MWVKRALAAGLLLYMQALVATNGSDVADAVQQRNIAAVRRLLDQHADVNVPQADGTTALHWAAQWDDLDLAHLLIRAGANAKAAAREGATPMLLACINGSAPMIALLVDAGVDVNAPVLAHGETPLMLAARTGALEALKVLLDRGADVNAREPLRGTTPLMWAIEQEHPAAAALLIAHGADVNAQSKVVSATGRLPGGLDGAPLFAAAPASFGDAPARGSAPARGERASGGQRGARGAAPDSDDDDTPGASGVAGAMTPLVYAARSGNLESTRILIEAGADPNKTSADEWTPLLVAVQNNYNNLASYLLDHGADPNIPNRFGWLPLFIATDNRNLDAGTMPVRAPDGDPLDLIRKLLDYGANPDGRSRANLWHRTAFDTTWIEKDGATAFLRAAQAGDIVLMKLLVEYGADPNLPTRHGTTPLMAAAGIGWVDGITHEWSEEQNLDAMKFLLDHGANVNVVNQDGRGALHGAAHKGRNSAVMMLVGRGARLDVKDKGNRDTGPRSQLAGTGWTPLDYAEGVVRVGVQSAIRHPEAEKLIRKLMAEAGLPVPEPRTPLSECFSAACKE
jgi:ankyrin repeat protein